MRAFVVEVFSALYVLKYGYDRLVFGLACCNGIIKVLDFLYEVGVHSRSLLIGACDDGGMEIVQSVNWIVTR